MTHANFSSLHSCELFANDPSITLVVWLYDDQGVLYSVALTLCELLQRACVVSEEEVVRPAGSALH